MDYGLDAQAKGYRWALQQERHSDYDEVRSYRAMFEQCVKDTAFDEKPLDEVHIEDIWYHWERGVYDAKWLLRHDENLSVSDIAERTGFDRSYIKAEIASKRLSALKVGTAGYSINPFDFQRWMKMSPRRGSRSK
jgi:AraC-like DNA-binding protein